MTGVTSDYVSASVSICIAEFLPSLQPWLLIYYPYMHSGLTGPVIAKVQYTEVPL